jgi:acetylornithine deacetylase/succinyl-diaminopimelate desuccinylase-like protein
LRAHLDAEGFADVAITVLGAAYPGLTDADDPLIRLSAAAGEEVYGLAARVTPLTGGTTPKYLFTRQGVPVVAPGVGYHQNNAHGPNEHVRLDDFRRAAKHLARVMQRFPALK